MKFNYKILKKAIYSSMVYDFLLAIFSLYQSFRITDEEKLYNLYFCYLALVVLLIQVPLLILLEKAVTPKKHRTELHQKIERFFREYPIVFVSLFGVALALPMAFLPMQFTPQQTVGMFVTVFLAGSFIQLIVTAQNAPELSKAEVSALASRYKWLRDFVLESSVYVGLSSGTNIAKNTVMVVPENEYLPHKFSTAFKTWRDDQEEVVLNIFWSKYGQKELREQFLITNLPKGKKGTEHYIVSLTILRDRSIQCMVDKPLKVERRTEQELEPF